MSAENLKKFILLIEKNPKMAKRVRDIGHTDTKGLIACAAESGLTIDEADIQAMKDDSFSSRKKLTDKDLEKVSGGWFFKGTDNSNAE